MTVSKRRRSSAASIPLRDRRVQQPRAVEVEAEVELVRRARQLVDLVERPDPPAGALWVFSTQTTRVRGEWIAGTRYAARTCSG